MALVPRSRCGLAARQLEALDPSILPAQCETHCSSIVETINVVSLLAVAHRGLLILIRAIDLLRKHYLSLHNKHTESSRGMPELRRFSSARSLRSLHSGSSFPRWCAMILIYRFIQ